MSLTVEFIQSVWSNPVTPAITLLLGVVGTKVVEKWVDRWMRKSLFVEIRSPSLVIYDAPGNSVGMKQYDFVVKGSLYNPNDDSESLHDLRLVFSTKAHDLATLRIWTRAEKEFVDQINLPPKELMPFNWEADTGLIGHGGRIGQVDEKEVDLILDATDCWLSARRASDNKSMRLYVDGGIQRVFDELLVRDRIRQNRDELLAKSNPTK